MATSISINNISKTYGETTALKNITFDTSQGEIFGIIGPDGAGKTTLFRILNTLLLPDSGAATIDGFNILTQFKHIRNHVGYMPGRFSLYQDLTVEENLTFFAQVFGTTIEENYSLIKDIYIQIKPFKNRKAGQLSGGMKQKLALCCALIHKPRILFLDEPTTGVDPVSRKEFWEILKHLKTQNISILVSTPYMDEATLCDRIALMQHGTILSINTPANIIQQYPNKLYAIKTNGNRRLLEELRANPTVNTCYIFGEYLHITFNNETPDIPNIQQIQPGIEDCFIHLMKQQ